MHFQTNDKQQYEYLDGWRGIAILWIVLGHYFQRFFWMTYQRTESSFIKNTLVVFFMNTNAVDIFLVIVGFLATGSLLRSRGLSGWAHYLNKRIIRIVPLYIFSVALAILLSMAMKNLYQKELYLFYDQNLLFSGVEERLRRPDIIPYFFLVQNYFNETYVPILAHTWFLAVVFQFYLGYSIVFKLSALVLGNDRSHKVFLAVFWVAIYAITLLVREQTYSEHPLFWWITPFRLDSLALGCLMKLSEPAFSNLTEKMKKIVFPAAFILGASGFLFIYLKTVMDLTYRKTPVSFTISSVSVFLMLIGTYEAPAAIGRVLKSRVLCWLGRHSYGIYIFHYINMYLYLMFSVRYGVFHNPVIVSGALVIFSLGTGYFAEYIQKKATRVFT